MSRRPTLALLAAVLIGSLAAVIAIQLIEHAGSPVGVPTVTPWVSPDARAASGHPAGGGATIDFHMRRSGRIAISIIDARGTIVRQLSATRHRRPGPVHLRWDARDDHGRVLPDGSYRVRLDLQGFGRPIVVPSPMRIDSRPPQLASVRFDATRIPTVPHLVRVFARTRDVETTQVLLDGVQLRVSRSIAIDQPDGSTKVRIEAVYGDRPLPARGTRLHLELVARDRAGNAAREFGDAVVPLVVHLAGGGTLLPASGGA